MRQAVEHSGRLKERQESAASEPFHPVCAGPLINALNFDPWSLRHSKENHFHNKLRIAGSRQILGAFQGHIKKKMQILNTQLRRKLPELLFFRIRQVDELGL